MSFMDKPEARFGDAGERIVARALRDLGFHVTRTSFARDPRSEGGARLDGEGCPIVIPDILAAAGGKTRWVEVKTKSKDIEFKKMREWRQGIEWSQLRHYLAAEEITGLAGWLAFLVLQAEGGDGYAMLRMAELSKMAKHFSPGEPGSEKAYDGKHLVYWPVDFFASYRVRQTELEPMPAKAVYPWPNRYKTSPTVQQGYFDW